MVWDKRKETAKITELLNLCPDNWTKDIEAALVGPGVRVVVAIEVPGIEHPYVGEWALKGGALPHM